MTSNMRSMIRAAATTCAAVIVALGLSVCAGVSPADAKPVAERGGWEGSVYVPRPITQKRAYYKKAGKRTAQKATKKKRYAALKTANDASPYSKRVTGGGVRWVANSGCLKPQLRSVIYQVAANYGSVTVSSTCRSVGHNRRVGGAKKSQHLTGSAADFRVHGRWGSAYAFLQRHGSVGGLKHYGGGLFHIDTGPRRRF